MKNRNHTKTIATLTLFFLGIIFISSCKKEYTCTCTWKNEQNGQTEVVSIGRGKYTKKDAEKECTRDQNETHWLVSPVTCELK